MNKPNSIFVFNKLSLEEKGKLVFLQDGIFVGDRTYYNKKTVLYNMGNFFAEVIYDHFTNMITDIIAIEPGSEKIDFYIS